MWLDDAQQDVRHALRTLVKNRGFTLIAILTLALGIGVNTAIFSVLDAVLLRPLPYSQPTELVAFLPVRYDAFRKWTEGLRSLEASGAYTYEQASVTGGAEPVSVYTLAVTSSLLRTLGVAPALGHGFSVDDDLPQAVPRVLLRHGFWQSQFGGDAGLVGRTIDVNGRALEARDVVRRLDQRVDRTTRVESAILDRRHLSSQKTRLQSKIGTAAGGIRLAWFDRGDFECERRRRDHDLRLSRQRAARDWHSHGGNGGNGEHPSSDTRHRASDLVPHDCLHTGAQIRAAHASHATQP